MHDLAFSFKQLTARNRDGSFATQANRQRMLSLFADQLHESGFKKLKAEDLKGRHVTTLVERWQQEGISSGTMKNRMSVVRWWAEKVGKQSVVARDNTAYGIADRIYVTNKSKALDLDRCKLKAITNEYVKYSLELQAAFGLRREEAIKFQVGYADKGNHILLKSSWTKGGKERTVLVRNKQQRELLDRIKRFVGNGSLIPPEKNYYRQMKVFERHANNAGIHGTHGLRHHYAQTRYQELTGRLAPAAGGKKSSELTPEEKKQDYEARLKISAELGHGREQITAVYLGR
jgi:site-specific recombinase XerC